MQKEYYVYILANKPYGTLYIGVTNNLFVRVYQHKQGEIKGFSKKYDINMLVYYESCGYINDAIGREKSMKKWNRQWKIVLIQSMNPGWRDLALDWYGD